MRSHHPLSGGSRSGLRPLNKLSGGSRSSLGPDHLAFVLAILFAALCGAGPFILLLALDKWGPL